VNAVQNDPHNDVQNEPSNFKVGTTHVLLLNSVFFERVVYPLLLFQKLSGTILT
jgi:hypothetical protein